MGKYEWEPPTVGEKKDDEVSCWGFGIPNLPIKPNKKILRFLDYLATLDGFQGLYPWYPHGTIIIFDTENNAKGGRNLIRAYKELDIKTGGIAEVFIKKEYLKGEK